jgi:signal transduction histidine kinase
VAITVSEVLRAEGFDVEMVLSGEEALSRIRGAQYDIVLTDLQMEGTNGITVLSELRRTAPATIAIVLTGYASLESAVAAIRHGAYDYLIKPCLIDDLKLTIYRGLEHRRLMLVEQEVRANLEALNRELERRVMDRTAELESVNEELRRANQAKDIFLATLSHELRTPLTPILGWSKLLRQSSTDPAFVMKGLDAIERNARLQTKLIDDLLDISRIVAGKLHLEMEPTDLRWVVKAAIETVRDKAEGAKVQLDTKMEDAPLVVNGSPAHLQQVVSNLLTNAIKFTPEGGWVNVEIKRERKSARIAVSDSGEGIAPEFLPQVFNLFAQGDITTTRRHGGLGLGLAIVRNVTELHGGTVHAHSDGVGRGARFTIVLPCADIESVEAKPQTKPRELSGLAPVLIIDDSPDALEMMRLFFTQAGCRTLVAASAEEALRVVKAERPAVVISDIGLPETDGYELMRQLRRLPGMDKIPAIALSGYAMEEDLARAIDAGFSAHMAKPVDPEKLIDLVQMLAQ